MFNPVHKLAIGTAQFGMDYGITNRNGQVHADEISAILDSACFNGINTIDTAKAYGISEKRIGDYIQQRPESSWNIITKLSENKKNVAQQIESSTKKLNVCPSIVLAHSTDFFLDYEIQKELAELKDKQSTGKFGVSLYNEVEINQVMESTIKPDVIQLPLNILDTRLYRREVISRLFDKDIEIHVRSVFLQGLFYLPEVELESRFSDAVPHLTKLKSVAASGGLTLAELSLLWLVSLKEVCKVIIGVDNAAQLKAHLETLKKKVDPAVFEEAMSIHYENETILNPSLWPSIS